MKGRAEIRRRRTTGWGISAAACLMLLLPFNPARSQDIEAISRGEILKATGGLSLTQMYTHARGKNLPRPAYSYLLQGTLNLKILGFLDAPFSFMYSNLGSSLTQPTFNQTSLHPTWKWIRLHAGTITVNWSPYTVSGHVFSGAAMDLTPGKWKVSALYGRFQRAVDPADSVAGLITPAYRRMGRGLLLGHAGKKVQVSANWFHASDVAGSIRSPYLPTGIRPQENHAIGVKYGQTLARRLTLLVDYGVSFLRADIRSLAAPATYQAMKSSLAWAAGSGQLSLNYERVDPNYRTLGAYYFNNDLENITAGGSVSLLRGRISLQGQAGLQRDNLNGEKWSRMIRQVGQMQMEIKTGKKSRLGAGYSNFLSYTNIRPYTDMLLQQNPMLAWDTLNFRQISRNVNAQFSTRFGSEEVAMNSLQASLVWQTAADRQNGGIQNGSGFYNAGIAWARIHKKRGTSLTLGLNAGLNETGGIPLHNYSPVFTCGAPLMKRKLQFSASICPTRSYTAGELRQQALTMRAQLGRQWKKAHRLNLSGFYQQAQGSAIALRREWSAMLVYGMIIK